MKISVVKIHFANHIKCLLALLLLYYCFLSILATAIITMSEDSNGASMKRTSRVPTYCLSKSENCDNLSCYIPRRSLN